MITKAHCVGLRLGYIKDGQCTGRRLTANLPRLYRASPTTIMAVARKVRPTLVQSNRATCLLLTLSLLVSPVTLALTVSVYLYGELTGTGLGHWYRRQPRHHRRKTVLITGGRANKALTLCRAFKHAGYRVILAEEEKWGRFTCARFSRAVDYFHLLPNPDTHKDAYIQAIKRLVSLWSVDVWVPCSSVHATMVDSEAAVEVVTKFNSITGMPPCEPFIPFPEIAGTLHWKDQFEQLCIDLDYPVPESKKVTSVDEAVEFLHSRETLEKGHKYLLKSLSLDDLGRDDFTLYPLPTRDETRRHLSTIPTPLSEKDPFILQRFLFGPEYCTHVAARNGQVVAFVACRSNPLLMRYADVRNLTQHECQIGQRLEQWTQEFLARYKAKLEREGKTGWEYALTGHFSFDFIVEDDTIYVIECNVVSTALLVLSGDRDLISACSAHIPRSPCSPSTTPSRSTMSGTSAPTATPSPVPRSVRCRARGSRMLSPSRSRVCCRTTCVTYSTRSSRRLCTARWTRATRRCRPARGSISWAWSGGTRRARRRMASGTGETLCRSSYFATSSGRGCCSG